MISEQYARVSRQRDLGYLVRALCDGSRTVVELYSLMDYDTGVQICGRYAKLVRHITMAGCDPQQIVYHALNMADVSNARRIKVIVTNCPPNPAFDRVNMIDVVEVIQI
nr:MAG TPA: hypothetical protein [Caudoviricetes sp.]